MRPRGLSALVFVYVAASLGLCAWAGARHPQELWGLGSAAALPDRLALGLLVGAATILVLAATGGLGRAGVRLERWWRRRPMVSLVVLLALVMPTLWALRSTQHWYGTPNAVRDLERLYTTNIGSSLFLRAGSLLLGWLELVEPVSEPGDALVATISLASAMLWIPLMVAVAGRLGRSTPRTATLALLLASPGLALFAGHREIYFVPALALGLFALMALRDLQHHGLPWRSGTCAGLALSAHLLNAAVLPAVMFVAIAPWIRLPRRAAGRLGAALLALSIVFAIPLLYRWAFVWDGTIPGRAYDVWGSLAHLRPGDSGLFWAFEPHDHPGFWAGVHLREAGNALLFHAPWLGLLPLLLARTIRAKSWRPELGLALVLWLGSLAVLLLDRPYGGHFLQWAHNGGFSLCSALLLAALLPEPNAQRPSRWPGALLALMLHQAAVVILLAHLGVVQRI